MTTARLDTTLKPGDIVALRKLFGYDSVLGVVRSVTTRGVRVAYELDHDALYSGATGASRNARLAEAGYRIVPLDAATRKDVLKVGFAHGKCSRAALEAMEQRARAFRAELLGPPVPAPDAAEAETPSGLGFGR